MSLDVILIGPIGAGKSTIGALLAARLGAPQVSLDALRFDYYAEIGYDHAYAQQLRADEGFLSCYRYWKPFEAYAVERVLADHCGCVFDFGAGHSVYEDETLLQRVERVMQPYAHVILLLPSPDLRRTIDTLREREGDISSNGVDFHAHFVTHPSNRRLAKHIVYTEDKTPAETCEEIMTLLTSRSG